MALPVAQTGDETPPIAVVVECEQACIVALKVIKVANNKRYM